MQKRSIFEAAYLPPEVNVSEWGVDRGYAASDGSGNTSMIEDPWEDL